MLIYTFQMHSAIGGSTHAHNVDTLIITSYISLRVGSGIFFVESFLRTGSRFSWLGNLYVSTFTDIRYQLCPYL